MVHIYGGHGGELSQRKHHKFLFIINSWLTWMFIISFMVVEAGTFSFIWISLYVYNYYMYIFAEINCPEKILPGEFICYWAK